MLDPHPAEHQVTVEVLAEARKDGRARMGVVPGQTIAVLIPFIAARIETGATIRTDGWKGYLGLERAGFASGASGKPLSTRYFPALISGTTSMSSPRGWSWSGSQARHRAARSRRDAHHCDRPVARQRDLRRDGGTLARAATGAGWHHPLVGWTRKIQMSQVAWLTTSAPSGMPAA